MKLTQRKVWVLLLVLAMTAAAQVVDESQAPLTVQNQLQQMRQEISARKHAFTVAYNPAMKYTLQQLCGAKAPADWWKKAREVNLKTQPPAMLKALSAALPGSWDWREHNGVTAIRDQGGCGSCWAFGTMGAFESFLLIKQSLTVDLSEQYLVSCNSNGWGCNGGWWAFDMLVSPGAVLESLLPYAAMDQACPGALTYPHQANGWAYVDGENKVADKEKIKQAILQIGPVAAAVFVGSYFQGYSGGVFDKNEAPSCWLCCEKPADVNHAIMLVGWNDAEGVWILRNSWGPGWGENGYMRIKYGVNNVGFAATSVY